MSANIEAEKNVYGKNINDHSNDVYAAVEYGGEDIQPREEETHRSLKPRQISMIAIGGESCHLIECKGVFRATGQEASEQSHLEH